MANRHLWWMAARLAQSEPVQLLQEGQRGPG